MKNSYFDLIDQTYYFPQEGFDLKNNHLTFHGISLKHLIDKYGTQETCLTVPLKSTIMLENTFIATAPNAITFLM